MRILVTGAAGFIGQHVAILLKEHNHHLIGLDSQVPGESWKLWDELYQGDITQPLSPSLVDLDAVIHLAALANPRQCDMSPGRAHLVNVHGTYNALELARKSGAHKFVFSSSAHVYGIPPQSLPTSEDAPLQPQSCYTLTKILGEELCRLYNESYNLSYTVLRLFNTYGPGQGPGYFVPDMICKAKQGHIELAGANTTKDFVYVEDVAQAFVKALNVSYPGTFNIGSGQEYTLGDVATQIMGQFEGHLSCTNTPNATRMRADTSLARDVLRWQPTVSLKEGLDRACKAASERPVAAQP